MEKNYYVYILIHKNGKIFKAGMSSNLLSRIKTLSNYWGIFGGSEEGSFLIKCHESFYKEFERMIHKLLAHYSHMGLERGDGYTEFFNIEGLKELHSFLNFLSNNEDYKSLFQVINLENEVTRLNGVNSTKNSSRIFLTNRKPIKSNAKIISFYNRKGGVGKTSLAYNIARDLNFTLLSNDDSVIESCYEKAYVLNRTDLLQCTNIVYDFGNFMSEYDINVLKTSDVIIVPTISDINSLRKTIRSLKSLEFLKKEIIIVGTKVKENDLEIFSKYLNIDFPLRESSVFQKSFIEGKSITNIVNESKFNRHVYGGVYAEYSNLLSYINKIILTKS